MQTMQIKNFALVPTKMRNGEPLFGGFGNQPLVYTTWVYLHGSLEKQAASQGGWDKFKWVGSAPEKDGIYSCIAIVGDEERISATAFLWDLYGKITGLVVADYDDESLLYALKQYKTKSDFI